MSAQKNGEPATRAGGGVRFDVRGELLQFDAERAEVTVREREKSKKKTFGLAPPVVAGDDGGGEAVIEDLVGKRVRMRIDKRTMTAETIAAELVRP